MPQGTGAFEVLTVAELVHHFSHFYEDALDPDETIELVGLTEKRDSRCSTLSGGQQRRVDLALGIVGNPELMFLDEPTTGLDPQARRQVWALVRQMTGLGKTVLLTTHYLDEAEALADRVAVIAAGRIVAEGSPRDIGGRSDAIAVITFEKRDGLSRLALPELPAACGRGRGRITTGADRDRGADDDHRATRSVGANGGRRGAAGARGGAPTLEDTYLRLIAAQREQETVAE